MLRCTSGRLALRQHSKYPALVSYHRLPWEQVAANSYKLHEHVSFHYTQLMTLAASTAVPQLVLSEHIPIPADMQLRLLPGSVYILPNNADGTSASPPTWTHKRVVDDSTSTQYYGQLSTTVAPVKEVSTYVSPDLRLYCNAVSFAGRLVVPVAPRAALEEIAKDGRGFTLFHFYRPNRPPTELTQPLMKYYKHVPQASALESFMNKGSWTPRLDAPRRSATARVTPMKPFVPPQSYLMGLAERKGLQPGASIGRRSLMWGHWF